MSKTWQYWHPSRNAWCVGVPEWNDYGATWRAEAIQGITDDGDQSIPDQASHVETSGALLRKPPLLV
jgi:hypothetical protein